MIFKCMQGNYEGLYFIILPERTLEQDTFSVNFGIWVRLQVEVKNCRGEFKAGLIKIECDCIQYLGIMTERRKEWEGGKKEKEKEGKTFRLCFIKKKKKEQIKIF